MNSTVKILVVEDELIIAHQIQRYVLSLGYELVHDFVDHSEAVFEILQSEKVDLILMDIHIKGDTDGIATALMVKEKYAIPVIFLTAFSDDKTLQKAKIAEPAGYILKPFNKADLKTNIEIAVYKAQQSSAAPDRVGSNDVAEIEQRNPSFFFAKKGSRYTKIVIEDIQWIEALDNYVLVYTPEDSLVVNSTMKDMEQLLPPQFFKIHRSFVVNLDKIDGFEDSYILIGKKALPVSRANKEALKKRILFL